MYGYLIIRELQGNIQEMTWTTYKLQGYFDTMKLQFVATI